MHWKCRICAELECASNISAFFKKKLGMPYEFGFQKLFYFGLVLINVETILYPSEIIKLYVLENK